MNAAAIFDRYQQLWAQRYGHPCALAISPVQYMKMGLHLKIATAAQLEAGLQGYFETPDPYVQQKRHPLGMWLASPMQWAKLEPVAKACPRCGAVPVCISTAACTAGLLAKGKAEATTLPAKPSRWGR